MTAKVNLLPQASRADADKTRQRGIAGGLVLLVVVALGLAWFFQQGVLRDAEDELATAQTELAAAQAEVAALDEFSDLERLLGESEDLLIGAMSNEVTLAGLLQDVALVTPVDGAFTAINVDFLGQEDGSVGTLEGAAEVEASHAPGVERFLLQLERPAGFRNVFPGTSAIDDDDIAEFDVRVQLGPEYRTERYVNGLPEVSR